VGRDETGGGRLVLRRLHSAEARRAKVREETATPRSARRERWRNIHDEETSIPRRRAGIARGNRLQEPAAHWTSYSPIVHCSLARVRSGSHEGMRRHAERTLRRRERLGIAVAFSEDCPVALFRAHGR
jgi:hypothetical protein